MERRSSGPASLAVLVLSGYIVYHGIYNVRARACILNPFGVPPEYSPRTVAHRPSAFSIYYGLDQAVLATRAMVAQWNLDCPWEDSPGWPGYVGHPHGFSSSPFLAPQFPFGQRGGSTDQIIDLWRRPGLVESICSYVMHYRAKLYSSLLVSWSHHGWTHATAAAR